MSSSPRMWRWRCRPMLPRSSTFAHGIPRAFSSFVTVRGATRSSSAALVTVQILFVFILFAGEPWPGVDLHYRVST